MDGRGQLSPQDTDSAGGASTGPAHPKQVVSKQWFSWPLNSPASLPTELPPAGPSTDPRATNHTPCSSEQTTTENLTPSTNEDTHKVWGEWLDVSLQCDREDALNISFLKLKEVDFVFSFFSDWIIFLIKVSLERTQKPHCNRVPNVFTQGNPPSVLHCALTSAGQLCCK